MGILPILGKVKGRSFSSASVQLSTLPGGLFSAGTAFLHLHTSVIHGLLCLPATQLRTNR